MTLSTQVLPVSWFGCSPNLRHLGQEDTWKGHRAHGLTRDMFLGSVAGRKSLHPQRTAHSGNAGAHPALHSHPHPLWTVELLLSCDSLGLSKCLGTCWTLESNTGQGKAALELYKLPAPLLGLSLPFFPSFLDGALGVVPIMPGIS